MGDSNIYTTRLFLLLGRGRWGQDVHIWFAAAWAVTFIRSLTSVDDDDAEDDGDDAAWATTTLPVDDVHGDERRPSTGAGVDHHRPSSFGHCLPRSPQSALAPSRSSRFRSSLDGGVRCF